MITAPNKFPLQLFAAFSALLLGSLAAGIYLEQYLLFLLPAAALFAFVTLADYPKIYYFLLLILPISFEFKLTRSLALNLPSEPIIIFLFLLLIVLWIKDKALISFAFLKHPIILLLGLHLIWILVLQLYTVDHVVSIKFWLAKLWFVAVGIFLTAVLVRSRDDFKKVFWCLYIPIIGSTLVILGRHAATGFSFEEVNYTVMPIFRNHVNYAALLTLFLPWAWYARQWYSKGSSARNWITFGILVLVAGTFFSYTRAAWVALVGALGAYLLIRWYVLRWFTLVAFVASLALIWHLGEDNRYLDYAPNYETTIYHSELGDHLEATVSLQDVSSAERVYRWVAAFHMFQEQPLTGYGPGNFYPHYKEHTVLSFRTYVSDNPEKSTVHNYYLLMLVEQGIIGFILFMLLVFVILFTGENIYHATKDKHDKQYVMALVLSLVIVFIHILVSDLIEVDKIGVLFFMAMALLVNQSLKNKGLLKPTAQD